MKDYMDTIVYIEEENGVKYIHYMGYAYTAGDNGEGKGETERFVEYTFLMRKLSEVLAHTDGIIGWENENAEFIKQYIRDCTAEQVSEIYNTFDSGEAPKEIYVDDISMDTPVGCYIVKSNKKIYIAGFDVFYDNAVERGNIMKEICKKYDLTGLFPFDLEGKQASVIFKNNLNLINKCDYVVANLNNFRGLEMDSGIAFEIGYAIAKGKKVYGYMDNTKPMIEKIGRKDKEGFNVEDFGLPINLMIGESVTIIEGAFEDCVLSLS